MSSSIEKVLPSGKFATIRTFTARDFLAAQEEEKKGQNLMAHMISIGVQIDGVALKYEEVLDMDLRDFITLQGVVAKFVVGPITS